MGVEEDLMQRLAVSKKIMERSEQIKSGSIDSRNYNIPAVQDFEPVQAKYNLPEEFLSETTVQRPQHDPTKPLDNDRVLNSKLPDEIKRLMIEQPIVQPSSIGGSATISEEVIQGAQRLMNMGKNKIYDEPTKKTSENVNIGESKSNYNTTNINVNEIKSMIRDVVRDTVRDVVREELKESGMLTESTTNTDETIQFKVGNTLFVGKVTKIKKLQK
jgi:hypothetical protein